MDATTYRNKDGQLCKNDVKRECKFNYGVEMKYGISPDKNRTQGAPRVDKYHLTFDNNGQAKSQPLRNHGRTVPHCHGVHYWGANNDLQHIHMPLHSNDTADSDGEEIDEPTLTRGQIEELSNILCACRRSGLDAANSLHIINRYLTSYCCKGGKSSTNWERASRSLIEAYCSRTGNADKSIRSVVSKLMLEHLKR